MNSKPPTRNYNMTDSELVMLGYNLCQNITRDQTQFTPRGVTATLVTALRTLVEAFEIFPPDSYYQADVSIAVEDKDNARVALDILVRDVVQCAMIKWGVDSPKYRKFGTINMGRFSDKEYLTACRQVVTTATGYLSDLTAVGLTTGMITAVTTGADGFLDILDNLNEAITVRDVKKGERIEYGNEIYSYISQYCMIGKVIWDDVDETKYNDYVIYPATSSGLSKPDNVIANWAMGDTVVHLNWDNVTGAATYDVYHSAVNFGLPSDAYTLLSNYPNPPQGVSFTVNKRNYYKIKAKNGSVVSDFSDEAWTEVVDGTV
ncbi:MAG: hypothetical protein NT007_05025 [Candidatus Kapabacteria bacterium]|nr:hypothetical protein [Candidatus Kapabacteria bacterium]